MVAKRIKSGVRLGRSQRYSHRAEHSEGVLRNDSHHTPLTLCIETLIPYAKAMLLRPIDPKALTAEAPKNVQH